MEMENELTMRDCILLCKFLQCEAKRHNVADASTRETLEVLSATILGRAKGKPIAELIKQPIIEHMIIAMCQMLGVLDQSDCDVLNALYERKE